MVGRHFHGRIAAGYRLDRSLGPAPVLPSPPSLSGTDAPAAEVVSVLEFLEPPPQLAGTEAVTVSLRVHLWQADCDLFYETGGQFH